MIGQDLLRFNNDLKLVVCDMETEGLHLGRSRPWQVAMLVFHGKQLVEEIDMYPWWPDLNISPGAAIVTRFKWDVYKSKATDPKKCREKYLSYRDNKDYRIIYHNGLGYDSMIDAVWAREIGEKPNYDWLDRLIDTNCVSKAMKKGMKPDNSSLLNFLQWQFKIGGLREKGLKSNLTTMGKEFKIEFDYAMLHDGLNDIKLNKLVLDKLIWTVDI